MTMLMGYRNLGSLLLVNWMEVFRSMRYHIPRIYDNSPARPRGRLYIVRPLSLTKGILPLLIWTLTMVGQVVKPLLRLELPDSMCNCIDWVNGGRLICGTSTGE
jgi:hypothetical protein